MNGRGQKERKRFARLRSSVFLWLFHPTRMKRKRQKKIILKKGFTQLNKIIQVRALGLRDDGGKGTPVPIPNTEVKLPSVESTWWVTAWEDRTSRNLMAL